MPVLHDPHDGFHGLAAVPASLCKADQGKALLVSIWLRCRNAASLRRLAYVAVRPHNVQT